MSTEGDIIKNIMDHNVIVKFWNMFIFLLVWYLFTITTYGVWCPSGLFLPGIIMGGSMGRFYTVAIQTWSGYTDKNEIMQNTVLGASAMLAGYCRLTYSLAVLMLETT